MKLDLEDDRIMSDSLASQFEEFMGRGVEYGALDIVTSGHRHSDEAIPADVQEVQESSRRKLILLEDLPNITNSSRLISPALLSFREAIHAFLATPDIKHGSSPCVLIISENLLAQSSSSSGSVTPHRILGPQLLNHPKLTSIGFNKIAPTILQRSLEHIVKVESKRYCTSKTPSQALLAEIGAIGDIRSAINALELIMVAHEGAGNSSVPLPPLKKGKKKAKGAANSGQTTESEKTT